MDVASTVYTLTVGIIKFLSEHDDKGALTEQLRSIALQVQSIITPLCLRQTPSEHPVSLVLESLQNVLSRIDDHLRSWKESKSRKAWALVNPWAVTAQMKEDREQLMHQYIMLMGAMQVVDYIKGYNISPSAPMVASSAEGNEVAKFWYNHFGNGMIIVEGSMFCDHISSLPGLKLDNVGRARLLLRLDENNSGCVTLATLQDLVKEQRMTDVLRSYTDDPRLPLLVWVDHDVAGNASKVNYAQSCGVTVIQLSSTLAAKTWININREFLKRNDDAAHIRFVSEQVRIKLNAEGIPFKNWQAGDGITRFLRSEVGLKAPILIYTAQKHLHLTSYVMNFEGVGSSSEGHQVYRKYVSALGQRRRDDTEWMRFGFGAEIPS